MVAPLWGVPLTLLLHHAPALGDLGGGGGGRTPRTIVTWWRRGISLGIYQNMRDVKLELICTYEFSLCSFLLFLSFSSTIFSNFLTYQSILSLSSHLVKFCSPPTYLLPPPPSLSSFKLQQLSVTFGWTVHIIQLYNRIRQHNRNQSHGWTSFQ